MDADTRAVERERGWDGARVPAADDAPLAAQDALKDVTGHSPGAEDPLGSWTHQATEAASKAAHATGDDEYNAAKQAAAERAAAFEALEFAKQGYLDDDPAWEDVESTASVDSVERYEREQDRLALHEWEEGVQQLRMAFQLVIIPFLGKWFGRQWSYWGACLLTSVCAVDGALVSYTTRV